MQQDILIIGGLFTAILLMMLNFGNRYTVLANLIRHLHDKVIRDNVSPNDTESFLRQIGRLRDRLRFGSCQEGGLSRTYKDTGVRTRGI